MSRTMVRNEPACAFNLYDHWKQYIADCAERCAASYDERQDLISDTIRALLEYGREIEHPKSFIRTTVRNLAINRGSVGAGAWELREVDLGVDLESPSHDPPLSEAIVVKDTLQRLLQRLTPAEVRCYELLKSGYEQRDLPEVMGITRQAASKLVSGIRRKYEALEEEDDA